MDDENRISKGGSSMRGSWLYIWVSEMALNEEGPEPEKCPVLDMKKDQKVGSKIGNRNERQTLQGPSLETIVEDKHNGKSTERLIVIQTFKSNQIYEY